MRKWEDIVKDKLEEPDGALPESVFDEFHARFDGAESTRLTKRFPLVWAIVPAIAAGLAVVLLLRSPKAPEEKIEPVRQAPMAQVQTTVDTNADSQVDTPKIDPVPVKKASARPQPVVLKSPSMGENQTEEPVTPETTEAPDILETPETPDQPQPTTKPSTGNTVPETTSPFIPMTEKARRVNLKVAPAAGGILGTGILAALATNLASARNNTIPSYIGHGRVINNPSNPGGTQPGGSATSSTENPGEGPTDIPPGDPVSSEEPVKDLLDQSSHYFPIQVGLSARLPLSERLYLSTGLQYSLYNSKFTMSQTGEKRQQVHYLGIPVRLDWVVASHSLFDVYLGGGVQGDFCLHATLAGKSLEKGRPSLSLVGAGGIQMNVTKRLGIYLEPELSWRIPVNDPAITTYTPVTYRSEHPVMFSIATGIRINLGY
jgi:hypothetical protein